MGRKELIIALNFLLVATIVFILEPPRKGFDLQGHLGWVPSHSAAQIIKATPKNGFVGHTLTTSGGCTVDYHYFDRYPVLFSGITKVILSPYENDLTQWFWYSTIWMNFIFLLTLFFSFRITGHFIDDLWKRGAVTLLSFSGYYFMTYKSMIHFDQPAILGMAALVDGIIRLEKGKGNKAFYTWAFLAPLLGRGYANIFTLILYFGLRLVFDFLFSRKKLETFLLASKTLIPAGVICTTMLAYNINFEAKKRNIEIQEVSIVKSALSRLGIVKFEEKDKEEKLSWVNFATDQSKRLVLQITPNVMGKSVSFIWVFSLFLGLAYVLYKYRANYSGHSDLIALLLMGLSGFFWLFPMRRLALFHDYTTLYYWAFPLVLYICVLRYIPKSRYLYLAALLIFVGSNYQTYRKKMKKVDGINIIAEDLQGVRNLIAKDSVSKTIYVQEGVSTFLPGRPYVLGFYFFDHVLANDKCGAEYLLTRTKREGDALFEGRDMYLYSVQGL